MDRCDEKGDLSTAQKTTADSARILLRGLAHVGIVGLVDEATGYQDVRDKMALQAILDAFLRKELAAWAKRFPDEFYEHIFRLRGWQWKGERRTRHRSCLVCEGHRLRTTRAAYFGRA